MNQKKVSFVTGSRADYGIVRNYLKLFVNDQDVNLTILATGALLNAEFGHQVDLIYRDGFCVESLIEIPIDPSNNKGVIHSMAVALDKFGDYFTEKHPDLLIILGDRYEMLSVATAAAMYRIPILHIHGGEETFGNYDEFIRHSITKMSLFHFTSTEEYRNRVIQLGEVPERVYDLGALGAENCLYIDESMVSEEVFGFEKLCYFVVLFHPETLTSSSVDGQTEELLMAINDFGKYQFVFIGTNADTHSDRIRVRIKQYIDDHSNCHYFESLPTAGYHYLLKHSLGLIGNSSSGIIEAPSLKTYTINIGHRQDGRVRGNSVLDVKCDSKEISRAIQQILNKDSKSDIFNPYYKAEAAKNYYKVTKKILQDLDKPEFQKPKEFYDLDILKKQHNE